MAVKKAEYRSGPAVLVDYTAAATHEAGDVVLVGNTAGLTCGVTHLPIANTAKGSLAVGGGVYAVKVAAAYTYGTKVWLDNTNSVLTTTSTNMSQFGYLVEA